MAITRDGTQSFGIQDSPITINTVTYVMEGASFTYGASRVDINDSNGEPLGATLIPSRVEGSATLQYAAADTANPVIGDEITFATGRAATGTDGVFVISEVGDAQSQGDYAKCSVSFFKKTN